MKFIPNLAFLRYFYSAGQSRSISKAAKDNFVSQSAISQAISKLESVLGKQLITHAQNRFQLTADGLVLLEKCKDIFQIFSEIEDAFHETDGVFKGKLAFACTHSFALSLLPPYLSRLSKQCGEIEPVLRLGHAGTIVELVKKGEVDFGIVLDNEDFSAFSTREIHQGQYRLYKAKKGKVLNRLIVSEERKEVALQKKHLFKKGMPLRCMEVSSWEVIASLTELGLGIGFLPDYMVGKKALVPFELSLPVIPYKILAISSRRLSRNAKMFLDLMS